MSTVCKYSVRFVKRPARRESRSFQELPGVAQNDWGWREMIEHGVTGFLGNNDCELAHYAAMLAYDEPLRQRIVEAAYFRLADQLANPNAIWNAWERLFQSLETGNCEEPGVPQAHTVHRTRPVMEHVA